MFNDDFEHDIAASMDDLDNIDTITIPPPASTPITTAKLAKFKRLPEIDENSTITDLPSSSADILFRVSSDALAACISGDLRKTVLINNSANEILSNSLINTSDESINEQTEFIAANQINDEAIAEIATNNDKVDDNTVVPATGTRRKFIVTRMDSNALLNMPRPEADNLKRLTPKSNYATISFPCSSPINHAPLNSLFGTNEAFEPHLDKRFFDTSLVRINANTTQSLNVSAASSQDNSMNTDYYVWERRKDFVSKPVAVSFETPRSQSVRDSIDCCFFCCTFSLWFCPFDTFIHFKCFRISQLNIFLLYAQTGNGWPISSKSKERK